MESRADTGGLIQVADGNGQQVSIAHIEADNPTTRRANHILTRRFPRLGIQLAAEQFERSSRDMDEHKHRRARALPAPVAVAVAGIEHLGDFEAHLVATTSTSEKNTHSDLHRSLFD